MLAASCSNFTFWTLCTAQRGYKIIFEGSEMSTHECGHIWGKISFERQSALNKKLFFQICHLSCIKFYFLIKSRLWVLRLRRVKDSQGQAVCLTQPLAQHFTHLPLEIIHRSSLNTYVFLMHPNPPSTIVFAMHRYLPSTIVFPMHYTKIRPRVLGRIDELLSEAKMTHLTTHQTYTSNLNVHPSNIY